MIRSVKQEDFGALHELWKKFYKDQFPFPDFLGYLCAFVVTDDSDRIVTAGGVRTIAEMLLVTDKELPRMTRYKAFTQILEASKFVAARNGFNNLNAIIKNDSSWTNILTKIGFEKDEILTMEL